MDFIIYGDVLVVVNFIINLFILRLCSFLSGLKPRTLSYYLSAFLGALCSFVIFLPMRGFFWDLVYRLFAAALMVFLAYGRQSLPTFGKLLLIFYAVSFLVAGVVIGLWFLFPSGGYAYRNGVVYFHIRPVALIAGVAMAYLLATAFNRIFLGQKIQMDKYRMLIRRGGRQVTLEALADTGNHLTEPFSGSPVVVASLSQVSSLLSTQEQVYILENRLDDGMPDGLRMVSYHTVQGDGILKAFRPDSIQVEVDGRFQEVGAYVAVSITPVDAQGCGAVFHPQLIRLVAAI